MPYDISTSTHKRNSASRRPPYSVNVPATISVSASGMSNGTRSNFPSKAIIAHMNPIMFTGPNTSAANRSGNLANRPAVCKHGWGEQRKQQGDLVRKQLSQRPCRTHHRIKGSREPFRQERTSTSDGEQVHHDNQVAGERVQSSRIPKRYV